MNQLKAKEHVYPVESKNGMTGICRGICGHYWVSVNGLKITPIKEIMSEACPICAQEDALQAKLTQAQAENDRLRGIARYATHPKSCQMNMQATDFCNCGLREAKQALKEANHD